MTRIRLDTASRMPLDPVLPLSDPPPREAPLVPTRYVELTLRTNFSFLEGASKPEEILARARTLDYDAIAVTDHDGLYGIVRAHEEAIKQGVRLIVGCELTFSKDGVSKPFSSVTVHVADHAGYSNLCGILTKSHALHPKGKARDRDGASLDPRHPLPKNCFAGAPLDVIAENAKGLWVLVPECTDPATLGSLKDAFGERASVAVHKHLVGDDRARLARAVRASRRFEVPICVTNDVRFASREDKPMCDILHCIREGVTLDQAGRALLPNAEAHLKSAAEMLRLFAGHDDWIARSRTIADACTFKMTELRYHFPSEVEFPDIPEAKGPTSSLTRVAHDPVPPAPPETPNEALKRLTYDGARDRYGEPLPDAIAAQIEKELALIAKIDVAPYFLSVRSIVKIARAKDILCQGRGSAANSAVCYCIGITAIDPARSNLLFERFLSAERREPPDIDVDFEHERREEVIQELYERFGRERAAMVSEVICYRGKSALREVGKVFGLSLEQVERLSAIVNWWDGVDDVNGARLRDAGFDADDTRVRMVLAYAAKIQGFPRHLSIHVGGFVLSSEPLMRVAPIEPATMKDRTIIPWDKDDLDTLGFFKVDVLGLGMLTAIRKALAFIQSDERLCASTAIDQLAKIPSEDPQVYEALCHADTVGVFQIESRAQMSMLPRLKPQTFYDLVVEVAIVRPGPIQGGMIHPYLRRRNGHEDSRPPHPCLEPILARTLGVPLFQEQVMQIAIAGAGYSGGEADRLRRDMAAWKKTGKLAQHKERLFAGFAARGIGREFAEKLYAQIQGFGEYGFPESHAASFALLVYASAWIKVHHPAAFAAALVNSQPMGFYSASTILQDAQKHGVDVRAIDVNQSNWDCSLEEGPSIRVGLRQVRGLGKDTGQCIETKRRERAFTGVEDLATRAALKKDELTVLAEAGALAALVPSTSAASPQRGQGDGTRRGAMWKVRAPRGPGRGGKSEQPWLFAGMDLESDLPTLPALSRAETLALDYARTGLSVHDHPMRIVRPKLPPAIKSATDVLALVHGTRASSAGLVICRQRPMTASGVVFITMEDETGFINLILYAHVFERFHHVATTASLLVAHGRIERDGEVVYIVVARLEPLRLGDAVEAPSMSRDFH
jgi:error-prone DNA polymerase